MRNISRARKKRLREKRAAQRRNREQRKLWKILDVMAYGPPEKPKNRGAAVEEWSQLGNTWLQT